MKRTFIAAMAIVLTFTFLLISCQQKKESKFLDKIITKDNLQEITTGLEQENLLAPEEILMFSNSLNRLVGINPDTLILLFLRHLPTSGFPPPACRTF